MGLLNRFRHLGPEFMILRVGSCIRYGFVYTPCDRMRCCQSHIYVVEPFTRWEFMYTLRDRVSVVSSHARYATMLAFVSLAVGGRSAGSSACLRLL
jgi:hypothetical protein